MQTETSPEHKNARKLMHYNSIALDLYTKNDTLTLQSTSFVNEEMFFLLNDLDELDRITPI